MVEVMTRNEMFGFVMVWVEVRKIGRVVRVLVSMVTDICFCELSHVGGVGIGPDSAGDGWGSGSVGCEKGCSCGSVIAVGGGIDRRGNIEVGGVVD